MINEVEFFIIGIAFGAMMFSFGFYMESRNTQEYREKTIKRNKEIRDSLIRPRK